MATPTADDIATLTENIQKISNATLKVKVGKIRTNVVTQVEYAGIKDYLRQQNVLNLDDDERICRQHTSKREMSTCLDILEKKGPNAFIELVKSMLDEYPWVVEAILATEIGSNDTRLLQNVTKDMGNITVSPKESPKDTKDVGNTSASPKESPKDTKGKGIANISKESSKESAKDTKVPIAWKKGTPLGKGRLGEVFQCFDYETVQTLAVKELKVTKENVEELKSLQTEIENQLRDNLSHERIVRYYGSKLDQDILSIFMEFVPGTSLCGHMKIYGPFPENVTGQYTKQILEGMAYLHGRNIIHGNIKGLNVLQNHSGNIKLCDFGVSKQLEAIGSTYGEKASVDSLLWMSPEIFQGCDHDRKTDVWSLGCTVVEMLTKHPPWFNDYKGTTDMIRKIVKADHPKYKLRSDASPLVKEFLTLCFKKIPEERPTANELVNHKFCNPFASVEKKAPGRAKPCQLNEDLITRLVKEGRIKTRAVEKAFRAVDRGNYFLPENREMAYDKDKPWKHGHIHQSSPCIYAVVIEALSLQPGNRFLNLGSGTGYLSTLAGLIIGSNGANFGVEYHEDVVVYAKEKLKLFKDTAEAIGKIDFCEPTFIHGNALLMHLGTPPIYDRVYCGAECPPEYENYMKHLIKIGGILVMPLGDKLLKITRTGVNQWETTAVLGVIFATLIKYDAEHELSHRYLENDTDIILCGLVRSSSDNDQMIDRMIKDEHIKTPFVEKVFRMVDRAHYYLPKDQAVAYVGKAWKNGNLHLSSPSIYSEVMEALSLDLGHSFLNLGSGTGYLSTLAGLIVGAHGRNDGIEYHKDVVNYAQERLATFKKSAGAVAKFSFCEPNFIHGNCLLIDAASPKYDRVYCGANCPPKYESYMKNLIKVGGILVMPFNKQLLQITRTSEKEWKTKAVLSVVFADLIPFKDDEQFDTVLLPH